MGNFWFIAAGNFTTADFRGFSGMDGRFDWFDSLEVRIIVSAYKKYVPFYPQIFYKVKSSYPNFVIKKHEFNKLF